ncbi:MAG TPA: response regulator [Clostridiales bacterium]|nr:response regulator [Clostridiales bacterium]
MLNVLIVDDEKATRDGLAQCIDWEMYGMTVIGEAAEGKEALKIMDRIPVDIVVSDVVMPVMDGIQLVAAINKNKPDTKVILVSGYSDIPYLKSAISLGAVDYIFKPVKLKELKAVLSRISSHFEKQMEQKKIFNEMKNKLEQSIPYLRERFITKLISGKIQDDTNILEQISFLGMNLNLNGYFSVMTVSMESEHEAGRKLAGDNELYKMVGLSALQEYFDASTRIWSMSIDEVNFVLLLSTDYTIDYNMSLKIASEIQQIINQYTGYSISIGIGSEVARLTKAYISYQQAIRALEQKFFLGEGQIIHFNDIQNVTFSKGFYPEGIVDEIIDMVRLGNKERVEILVDRMFEDIFQNSCLNLKLVQNICFEAVTLANRQLLQARAIDESHEAGLLDMSTLKDIFKPKSLKETHIWLKNLLYDAAERICTVQSNISKNIIIEFIKKAINDKYHEDISLLTMALEFCLTPNYLCLIFKKETGETFNDYLTKVRVQNARELLKDPTYKIYEIAEMVGYRDSDYFARVFKKITGFTPSEFRKGLIL